MAKMMHREARRPDRADVVGRLPGETQEACQRLACDGPCETVRAWCPDCDRETEHVRISPTFRECAVCGELSRTSRPFPCPWIRRHTAVGPVIRPDNATRINRGRRLDPATPLDLIAPRLHPFSYPGFRGFSLCFGVGKIF